MRVLAIQGNFGERREMSYQYQGTRGTQRERERGGTTSTREIGRKLSLNGAMSASTKTHALKGSHNSQIRLKKNGDNMAAIHLFCISKFDMNVLSQLL